MSSLSSVVERRILARDTKVPLERKRYYVNIVTMWAEVDNLIKIMQI